MSAYSWQLCFLLVLAVSANSPCTGEDSKDLLQTGVVEFTNSGYESSSCFSIPIRYNIPSSGFKTALCTLFLIQPRLTLADTSPSMDSTTQ